MPGQRRVPAPKSSSIALAERPNSPNRAFHLAVFFFLFAVPLFAIHWPLLGLPFFWDEQGQFIPTALDLLRSGAWIAHSTIPNVHPPGVEAYLVIWYKLFGFSIPLTRAAMLIMAGFGLLLTFLLAIELSRDADGAPAFLPPFLLLASPLFYTQSMMAQLDMPAMVFTLLSLLLFLKKNYVACAVACIALVLVKETGIVAPAVFFAFLAWRKDWKRAGLFTAPAIALGCWLLLLHHATGYWLGNPGFAHYNVGYALNPVRMALSFARRIYYIFFAEFRWIGTILLLWAAKKRSSIFRSESWRVALAVSIGTLALVSIFGGAELERYLLPVLPIFYIAVSIALASLPQWTGAACTGALLAGLIGNLFWNPPYPFPYENNLAMVDFVRLQQAAANFAEQRLGQERIATAWPYTVSFEDPDYGFVKRKLNVLETNDFHFLSIAGLSERKFDALITYSRSWAPPGGVIALSLVRRFLEKFYDWQPDITPEQCEALGLSKVISWKLRGQEVDIYLRERIPPPLHAARYFLGGARICSSAGQRLTPAALLNPLDSVYPGVKRCRRSVSSKEL
jgi:hypothetical protein